MANCPNCGAPLESDAANCKFCGWVKPVTTESAGNSGSGIIGEKKYCSSCGAQISVKAEICPKCGVRQKTTLSSIISDVNAEEAAKRSDSSNSPKSRTTTLLLCLFLGILGAHRFYVGKTGSAIGMLLLNFTGIGEIWAIIDFINILCGSFKDSDGKKIVVW